MSESVYGDGWNEDMGFMIDAISETEARRRYTDGPQFSVAVGKGLLTTPEAAAAVEEAGLLRPVPDFSVNFAPGPSAADVYFYDAHGSIVAIYGFRRHDQHTLFLHDVMHYTYPDELRWYGQDEATVINSFTFKTDGTSRETRDDRTNPMVEAIDRHFVDLTKNWEPVPAFGDWASIGRADRRP